MTFVHTENCLETMKRMPDNSVDAIVTDPPYGLSDAPDPYEVMKSWIDRGYHEVSGKGFMAKEWDAFVPQPVIWKECLRILKPGGYLLAFASTRTQDWMTMALRFAGFDITTSVYWCFGSGFPKGLNIGKAIDKLEGNEQPVVGKYQPPNGKDWNLEQAVDENIDAAHGTFTASGRRTLDITAPVSDDAKKWQGWNTQLKPSVEPITVARKPIEKGLSIAENVLKWGVGALNIDGCRVGVSGARNNGRSVDSDIYGRLGSIDPIDYNTGRYPSTLIHDGSDDVVDLFPNTTSGAMKREVDAYGGDSTTGFLRGRSGPSNQHGDAGSAARFFYCAKATNVDREEGLDGFVSDDSLKTTGRGLGNTLPSCPVHQKGLPSGANNYSCGCPPVYDVEQTQRRVSTKNSHPTVKPTSLMRYLCRLVTPVGGLVYDPFSGSGSTGKAAMLEGFEFIGSELDVSYAEIANARILYAKEHRHELDDEYVLDHVEKVMPKVVEDNGYF